MRYCKICNNKARLLFDNIILKKYNINYYLCDNCDFVFTENPYWLEEAYKSPINLTDTGILSRNIYLSRKATILIYFLWGKKNKYLDYAGGYGLFTRLMRDIGLDFCHYDPLTSNIFAKGFEYNVKNSITAITCWETFEHFVNPIEEIEKMLKISDNIIFSTELLPKDLTKPLDWWYWGFEHGQHISFYSQKTLKIISNKYKLNFYTNNRIHLLTKRKINYKYYKYVLSLEKFGLYYVIGKKLSSKTREDSKLSITYGGII